MTITSKQPSLLPYLQSGPGRFHLTIGMTMTAASSPTHSCDDLFQITDIANPFAFLGHGCFANDLDEPVVLLDMLMQRSSYPDRHEEEQLATNAEIDRRWQQILTTLATPPLQTLNVLLAEQIGRQGQLLPFHALFYCRIKQQFFHPPCPVCGAGLQLCTNDTLLIEHGLPGYSASLRRFLYCPHCTADASSGIFYVVQRLDSDPVCVGDIDMLIGGWSQLSPAVLADWSLPCHDCSAVGGCFGENRQLRQSLCSFSFYPFYLLLLKGDLTKSLDFHKLLSGQGAAEVFTGHLDQSPKPACENTFPGWESAAPSAGEEPPETAGAGDDTAIRQILATLVGKWKLTTENKSATPDHTAGAVSDMAGGCQGNLEDFTQTIVLDPLAQSSGPNRATDWFGKIAVHQQDAALQKTMIQSAPPTHPPNGSGTTWPKEPGNRGGQTCIPHGRKNGEGDLLETVILSPRPDRPETGQGPSPSPAATNGVQARNAKRIAPKAEGREGAGPDLAETIIQRPVKRS